MKITLLKTSLLTIVGIAACLPSLSANNLLPGQTVSPDVFTTAANSAGYTFVASTGLQNVNPLPGTSFNASYTEYVYRDANNVFCNTCLDFLISLSNAGPGIIERISTADFGAFLTDVGYNTSGITGGPAAIPAGIIPFDVTRSVAGDIIGFDFVPLGTAISSGQSAVLLEIQTNATNYRTGTVSVQDGTAGFAAGLVPSSAAPEPVSLALFGSGLLGLGLLRKRFGAKA
jgi:hypothetical protein